MAGPAHQHGAGGYVIRDGRWVLPGPPEPVVRRLPGGQRPQPEPVPDAVDGDPAEPMREVQAAPQTDATEPARADCPDCGKQVAVNKSGTLRKHTCTFPADPPDLTFQNGD